MIYGILALTIVAMFVILVRVFATVDKFSKQDKIEYYYDE
jgi:hypothetical protein